MGNSLNKSETNLNNNTINKDEENGGRKPFLQICPHRIRRRKHIWEKQILETCPPQQKKMESQKWNDQVLIVPNSSEKRPIPPPRKKRSNEKKIKNGFEQVFSVDGNEKPKVTVTRKISKVGNKKSDKFFGENLSDCLCDDPVAQPKEQLVSVDAPKEGNDDAGNSKENINENKENEEKEKLDSIEIKLIDEIDVELARKIKKEKGKMMFALEKHMVKKENEDDRFTGESPIKEELIVPVKKVRRHVCDDDERIHDITHNKPHSAPKKPRREFEKNMVEPENLTTGVNNKIVNATTEPKSEEPSSTDNQIDVDVRNIAIQSVNNVLNEAVEIIQDKRKNEKNVKDKKHGDREKKISFQLERKEGESPISFIKEENVGNLKNNIQENSLRPDKIIVIESKDDIKKDVVSPTLEEEGANKSNILKETNISLENFNQSITLGKPKDNPKVRVAVPVENNLANASVEDIVVLARELVREKSVEEDNEKKNVELKNKKNLQKKEQNVASAIKLSSENAMQDKTQTNENSKSSKIVTDEVPNISTVNNLTALNNRYEIMDNNKNVKQKEIKIIANEKTQNMLSNAQKHGEELLFRPGEKTQNDLKENIEESVSNSNKHNAKNFIKFPNASESKRSDSSPVKSIEKTFTSEIPRPKRPTRVSDVTSPNIKKTNIIFKRSLSTQSYLTNDLLEKITQQTSMLSLPDSFDYSPEDALHDNDDGSVDVMQCKIDKRPVNSQLSNTSSVDEGSKNNNTTNTGIKIEVETSKKTIETPSNIEFKINSLSGNKFDDNEYIIKPKSTTTEKRYTTKTSNFSNPNSVNNETEISETIKSFLKKEDLRSKEILELLQFEFGDNIFSQSLSPDDQKIISDLQKAVKREELQENNKSCENKKNSKIPVFKSKHAVNVSNERRHSAIDDFDSWFSPEKNNLSKKRFSEANVSEHLKSASNLEKYIHENSKKTVNDIDDSAKQLVKDVITKAEDRMSDLNVNLANDHSALLKFLDDEKRYQ